MVIVVEDDAIAMVSDEVLFDETRVVALSVTETLASTTLPMSDAGTFQNHVFDVNELLVNSIFAISARETELNTV